MNDENNTVLVTGASGFIGTSLIKLLLKQNYHVKALFRNSSPNNLFNSTEYIQGDIRDFDKLCEALHGVDALIHLAACKADEIESYDVNVGGAKNLIKACKANGVKKIINVSTQSALLAKRGTYGETKLQADRLFEESELEVVTLYPSLIYGDDQTGVFAKLIKQINSLPLVPIIGNGKTIFQPLYVEDLSKMIMACLQKKDLRKMYEVGSTIPFTFDQLIDEIQNYLGTHKKKIHVPWFLGYWAAVSMKFFYKTPHVSVSNVLALSAKNIRSFDTQAMLKDLAVVPLSLEEGFRIISRV